MKDKIKVYIKLFLTFFKIGAFTFGGGYAMIPLIEKEAVEKNGWIDENEVLDIIAIAESTPGPIAINSATFVGFKVAGFFGSLFSTVGIVLPSFIVITAISYVYAAFKSLLLVKYAFFGIRAGVLALIVRALYSMYKKSDKNIFSYILTVLSFAVSVFFDINVIWIIVLCAVCGLVYYLIKERNGGAK